MNASDYEKRLRKNMKQREYFLKVSRSEILSAGRILGVMKDLGLSLKSKKKEKPLFLLGHISDHSGYLPIKTNVFLAPRRCQRLRLGALQKKNLSLLQIFLVRRSIRLTVPLTRLPLRFSLPGHIIS